MREFKHADRTLSYVPALASNMDGVGTSRMAKALQKYKMMTIRKHYNPQDWKYAMGTGIELKYIACRNRCFMGRQCRLSTKQVMTLHDIPVITIDVANGYSNAYRLCTTY